VQGLPVPEPVLGVEVTERLEPQASSPILATAAAEKFIVHGLLQGVKGE
jgi:hypothetical protein